MNWTTREHAAGRLDHLKTLEEAVDHFLLNYPMRHNNASHDVVLNFTKTASSLTEAVERACAGVTADGVKFKHDQNVQPLAVENLRRRLLKNIHAITAARNFDALHDLIQRLKPKGIEQLKIYDVSMRVGAYLKIEQHSNWVYLHSGALMGWENLTGEKSRPYRVPISSMPAALRVMPHYMIEDFFCEYR